MLDHTEGELGRKVDELGRKADVLRRMVGLEPRPLEAACTQHVGQEAVGHQYSQGRHNHQNREEETGSTHHHRTPARSNCLLAPFPHSLV